MTNIAISLEQARRFLVSRQSFAANGSPFRGPEGVAQVISQLEAVQIDPLCVFERNHHQVLYNRVQGYRPEWLDQLLYLQKGAFEYYCNALCILPMADYPYFRHEWQRQQSSVATRFGWSNEPKAGKKQLLQELIDEGLVASVSIEGVRRTYYCPMELTTNLTSESVLPASQTAVILAPLDNLLWDRDRLDDLWGFNYRWEVYTPVAKRRYGHYVVPVMHGERFVGRIELRADKTLSELRVDNLWLLPSCGDTLSTIRRAVELEASYLGLARINWAK